MLAQVHRMRGGDDFRVTVRRGAKAARPTLVAHVARPFAPEPGAVSSVGFVVSRSVGTAVDRNRVKRRLRHLMRARLSDLPTGSRIVVRALPASKLASSAILGDDLDSALRQVASR